MTHVAFLGDGEKTFALPYDQLVELEAKTGAGIGALFHRIRSLTFGIADIAETIRLGLIGGGADPKTAFLLVDQYVKRRPLAETLPVALGILEAVWFGTSTDSQGEPTQPSEEASNE